MTENSKQNTLLVIAGSLAVLAAFSALNTKDESNAVDSIKPNKDVSVRVVADDGTVLMFSDCEAKQERDGTITIKASGKGNL